VVNGKVKGSSFEREVCKLFSLWISGGQNEDLFWRSAMSGGRATVAHRKGKVVRQSGDITAVAPEAHFFTDIFFMECKFLKKLQIDKFILLGEGTLAKFWQVCIKEAAKHGRKPMLIARENGKPPLVITQKGALWEICDPCLPLTLNPEVRLLRDLLKSKIKHVTFDLHRSTLNG
jgi:hypothetical protein